MQSQTDILSQPILDKIVLRPKFGFSSFLSIVSLCFLPVFCLGALVLHAWPFLGLFLGLSLVVIGQVFRIFTPLGHITLTQEGLRYYSPILLRNTYYRWDEIERFELIPTRYYTAQIILFWLKQKSFRPHRALTLSKMHDYTPEELVDALNKRLDALQSFFPQSNDQVVVFKVDPIARKILWATLLILSPLALFLMCALGGLLVRLGSENYPLQIWLLVVSSNVMLLYLIPQMLRFLLSPDCQMLTLNKEQITVVGYFKRVKAYSWADIKKFEIRPKNRGVVIYMSLKSQDAMQELTFSSYEYQGGNFSELLDILNQWLERYGSPAN